jgi:hypothetical protein
MRTESQIALAKQLFGSEVEVILQGGAKVYLYTLLVPATSAEILRALGGFEVVAVSESVWLGLLNETEVEMLVGFTENGWITTAARDGNGILCPFSSSEDAGKFRQGNAVFSRNSVA